MARLLGYCLLTNHVHLVAIPERPASLALALGQLHGFYARYFNQRYRRSGHRWQNRFYSCPLGRSHVWRALLYVDLNPVRAGLAGDPMTYPWSSAAAHAGWHDHNGLLDWWEWSDIDLKFIRDLKLSVNQGQSSNDSFPRQARNSIGRDLSRERHGRRRLRVCWKSAGLMLRFVMKLQ